MTAPIRTIHVGVGNRGRWPVEIMGRDSHYQPAALVDLNKNFLADAQTQLRLSDATSFPDLTSALQQVDADAVIICTPTRTHAELCRAAFAAGKHVLDEKGMTYDFVEANALVREAEQAGVKFCVAQNYRFGRNEQTITKLLDDKSHPHHPGDVKIVDYFHHRYRPEPRTLNYPYAMIWDMGCHHVDSLCCWLGEAKRVTAISRNPPWSAYGPDADIHAIIEYAGGAVCTYVLTHAATMSWWHVMLQGERGALRTYDVPGVQFVPKPQTQLGSSDPIACELVEAPSSEQGVADAFRRYILENVEPGISGRNNLKTLAVCEMLVRSARGQRPVERAELA
jgi:predicted dehydrogenase